MIQNRRSDRLWFSNWWFRGLNIEVFVDGREHSKDQAAPSKAKQRKAGAHENSARSPFLGARNPAAGKK